jgi:hypothetical protein
MSARPRALLRLVLALAATLAVLGTRGDAAAHTVGLSSGEYGVRGARLDARLVFARGEIVRLVPLLDVNGDGHVSAAEAQTARPQIRARIVDRMNVSASGGAACEASLVDAAITEGDGLLVVARWTCGAALERVDLAVLEDLGPTHRHVARVVRDGAAEREQEAFDRVLSRDARVLALEGDAPAATAAPRPGPRPGPAPATGTSAAGFLALGLEHILRGLDHVLFLLALVLVPSPPRALLRTITAFTLAHSLTLALTALAVWSPSPRLVEPAIALSIAWVALENVRGVDPATRWRVTLPFGLVHGFGFASVLRELDVPRARVFGALLAFNGGVELGQLLVLAALVPVLAFVRARTRFEPRGARAISFSLVAVGLAWCALRMLRAP